MNNGLRKPFLNTNQEMKPIVEKTEVKKLKTENKNVNFNDNNKTKNKTNVIKVDNKIDETKSKSKMVFREFISETEIQNNSNEFLSSNK